MVVALTGGTGFVGRPLVGALQAAGHRVRTLGRTGADVPWEAPAALPPSALAGCDAVVHLAARVPADHADPAEGARCLEVNALGTLAVLEAAEAAGVPHAVSVSTGNLYRSSAHPGDRAPVGEQAPTFPDQRASFYLGSKLVADVWASHFDVTGRVPGCVVRPSAIYGPGMKGGVVHAFLTRLRAGQPLRLADGGRFASDLVYVGDVVAAILAALRVRLRGPVNVGSGRTTSVRELAETLCARFGVGPEALVVEPPSADPAPGFAPLDVTRLREALGLVPTPVAEGLRKTVEAHPGLGLNSAPA